MGIHISFRTTSGRNLGGRYMKYTTRKILIGLLAICAIIEIIFIINCLFLKEETKSFPDERENFVVSDKIMTKRKQSVVPAKGKSIILLKNGIVQMVIPVVKVGQTCIDKREVIVSWTEEKCKE